MTRYLTMEDLSYSSPWSPHRSALRSKHPIALDTPRQALMSLEAMGSFLKLQNPNEVGDCGVRMANIAIEQICASAGLELPRLTIDHKAYRKTPKLALEEGLEALEGTKRQLLAQLQDILLQTLLGQAERRTDLDHGIGRLWHAVADLERRLETLGDLPADRVLPWQHFDDLLYVSSENLPVPGLREHCADVAPNLCHFLTEHSHLYKRLIKKQIDWIEDHRDNLLKGPSAFDQYVFNPIDYLAHGQSDHGLMELTPEEWQVNAAGTGKSRKAYRSQELPGGMAFWSYTCAEPVFGIAGIEEMGMSIGQIGPWDKRRWLALRERHMSPAYTDGQTHESAQGIPRLDLDSCKARLAEVKRAISALEHWSEIAFCKLWKDACFEQVIMAELLKTGETRSPAVEQGLIVMANSLVRQLEEASYGVGSYVTRTLDALLIYIEKSIAGGTQKEISQ